MKGSRATSKSCGKQMMGLTDRMKPHFEATSGANDLAASPTPFILHSLQPTASPPVLTASPLLAVKKQKTSASSVANFVIKTTASLKQEFDHQVARFIYATNSPFNLVENKEFLKLLEMLRPG